MTSSILTQIKKNILLKVNYSIHKSKIILIYILIVLNLQ